MNVLFLAIILLQSANVSAVKYGSTTALRTSRTSDIAEVCQVTNFWQHISDHVLEKDDLSEFLENHLNALLELRLKHGDGFFIDEITRLSQTDELIRALIENDYPQIEYLLNSGLSVENRLGLANGTIVTDYVTVAFFAEYLKDSSTENKHPAITLLLNHGADLRCGIMLNGQNIPLIFFALLLDAEGALEALRAMPTELNENDTMKELILALESCDSKLHEPEASKPLVDTLENQLDDIPAEALD